MFLEEYGLFLAKSITVLVVIFFIISFIASVTQKGKIKEKGQIKLKKLNNYYQELKKRLQTEILSKTALKKALKKQKQTGKKAKDQSKSTIFVIKFKGDIKASAVKALREEVTAILTVAKQQDEVVVCLESPGGLVHGYGLAASQLKRLRDGGCKLTVIVDKVAASGGYLMAVVADRIIAAPFAVIGSIGVIAQLPNFHRYLKSKHIDFEQLTAGQYKRTLTLFGENTSEARKKLQEEIDDTHQLFKSFIQELRPQVDLAQVATGEHWYGKQALALNLIDELQTSDDYLLKASEKANLYQVSYQTKKPLPEKIAATVQLTLDKIWFSWWQRSTNPENTLQ